MLTRIKLSSAALSDHLSRLYENAVPSENPKRLGAPEFRHIDAGGLIVVISDNGSVADVEMGNKAINEFIEDMKYQIEFADEPHDRAYRNQCRRALASLQKQIAGAS